MKTIAKVLSLFAFSLVAFTATAQQKDAGLPFVPKDIVAVEGIALNMATTLSASAYTQLDSSLDDNCDYLDVYNGGSSPVYLAVGAASSESNLSFIFGPSSLIGFSRIPVKGLNAGKRLAAKSAGADMTSGYLVVNCFKQKP